MFNKIKNTRLNNSIEMLLFYDPRVRIGCLGSILLHKYTGSLTALKYHTVIAVKHKMAQIMKVSSHPDDLFAVSRAETMTGPTIPATAPSALAIVLRNGENVGANSLYAQDIPA